MSSLTRSIAIGAALLMAGLLPARAQDQGVAAGLALIEKNCARCHAVGRTGMSPRPEAPPFRDLSRRYPIESLAEALAEGIITGHNDMPEFRFAPHEISAILAYLNAIASP